jgi:hypothetical protein
MWVIDGITEGRRPLRRPRHNSVDNIKKDLGQIEWVVVDWIDLAQDTKNWWDFVDTVLTILGTLKCMEIL